MNPAEKPAVLVPSASEYILDNFEPTDRIAMLVLNRDFGETIQRITSAAESREPRVPGLASLQERQRLGHLYRNEPAQERCLDANQGRHRVHPARLPRPGPRRPRSPRSRREFQRLYPSRTTC